MAVTTTRVLEFEDERPQRSRIPGMLRLARRKYSVGIQHIREALVASGYTSLDQQAKALGVHRSTAWTIIKATHKLGRLSRKTTVRILANPDTPPSVRAVIQQYLAERSIGSAKKLMWANSDDPLQRDRLS